MKECSVEGRSAWTFSETRGEFYLHNFLDELPDLNLTNPLVQREIQVIVAFWWCALTNTIDDFRFGRPFFDSGSRNLPFEASGSVASTSYSKTFPTPTRWSLRWSKPCTFSTHFETLLPSSPRRTEWTGLFL